ncbi:MAG: hypothetical protein GXP62_19430 [Oligoflexia bacterium]|nr:hypothetical protein [Oligoflexia bacterium]
MKLLFLCWLCSLAGCGLGLQPFAPDAGLDSGQAHGAIWVDDISPTWGPTAGGTAVTIRGGGFQGDVSVLFGGASVEVTVLGTDELAVTSPATSIEITVDLTVRSDKGETVVSDGFTYSDSGPPDTGSTGGTGTGDGGGTGPEAGKVSGFVEFYYTVTACPSCFVDAIQLDIGADARFHAPVNGSWLDWLPPQGSCSAGAVSTPLTSDSIDVGDWVYLQAGTTSHGLRRTTGGGQTLYQVTGLASDDYVRNSSWDLSVADGASWGPFTLTDLLATEGFDDIQPSAILNDSPQAFTAQINPNNATFSWAPSGLASDFITIVDAYRSSDGSYIAGVVCDSADSGSVTVPVSALSGFPSGSLLVITMYRYQVEDAINPVDGSTVQGVSSFGLVGTGVLR